MAEEEYSYDEQITSHQDIGIQQKLFMFHEVSPGSCFFLPHGTRIYNKLVDLIKKEYLDRNYHEVITPNIFKSELWKQSGHWDHYKNDMFSIKVEDQDWALKPMNCPGHCLIFDSTVRSYKELPIKLADFGVLHRNEASGSLRGLTRVRRFQQDDAHIFCRMDQIEEQIDDCLDFMKKIYEKFGFTYELELSTRPEKYIGDIESWDNAEKCLSKSLSKLGCGWELNKGDGAFYGPKIDIKINDSSGRELQCGTIQLDFQLPNNFNLKYEDATEKKIKPVIIHRAILGSVERMIAILAEHYDGVWPFWLSPRQIMIVPVHDEYLDYCNKVKDILKNNGYYVEVDDSSNTMKKKIVSAEKQQYNYILVVGKRDKTNGTVNIRCVRDRSTKDISIELLLEKFKSLV
jgi:threonyl-tRNA synthetase